MSALVPFGYPMTFTAAANTAVVATLPAKPAGYSIDFIECSYSVAPIAGRLSATINGVLVFDTDITAAGSGPRNVMWQVPADQSLVITLAAGGGTTIGKLNITVS